MNNMKARHMRGTWLVKVVKYWTRRDIHLDKNYVLYVLKKRYILCMYVHKHLHIQGGSNMTGKNCDLFTHK